MHRVVQLAVAVSATGVLVACGGSPPDTGTSSSSGTTSSTSWSPPSPEAPVSSTESQVSFSVPTADPCPTGVQEVPMIPEDANEAWLSPTLRVCDLGDGDVTVRNAGPAVWVVDEPEDLSWDHPGDTSLPLAVQLFRVNVAPQLAGLPIEPEQSARIHTEGALRIRLDPQAQAAWTATEKLYDKALEKARERGIRQLPNGTLRVAASCGVSGYEIGKAIPEADSDYAATKGLFTSISAAKDCATALDEEARRSTPRSPALLTTEDLRLLPAEIEARQGGREVGHALLTSLARYARRAVV